MDITNGKIVVDLFCNNDADCTGESINHVCTKGLTNPINGVTSFNNIGDSAIMVW